MQVDLVDDEYAIALPSLFDQRAVSVGFLSTVIDEFCHKQDEVSIGHRFE